MAWALIGLLALVLTVHLVSLGLAAKRRGQTAAGADLDNVPITLIRPICGLDRVEEITLESSFRLRHRTLEILFCCEDEHDPAAAYVRRLIEAHPAVDARLLIGGAKASANPKLTNMATGWHSARYEWIAFIDSNVLLQPSSLAKLLGTWRARTGLVCAPPVGIAPGNFWAEVECAFLNSHQARWQYAADALGSGFAQGKTMLWRRSDLIAAGGVEALARELAEDAAATKIVREAGRTVGLCDSPSAQPLGERSFATVLGRQVRWAQLRRMTFPVHYAPEILCNGVIAAGLAAIAADTYDSDPLAAAGITSLIWYGGEVALSVARTWPLTWRSPVAMVVRDLMLPMVWAKGWTRAAYRWRGRIIAPTSAGAKRSDGRSDPTPEHRSTKIVRH